MSNANRDGRVTNADLFEVGWHTRHQVEVGQDFASTTLADVTALVVPVSVSALYEFEALLFLTSPDTAGLEVGVNGPSGAAVIAIVDGSTTTTAASQCNVQALNTKSTTAYCALVGNGVVRIRGWLTTDSTHSGSLSIQVDKKTSGTGTVLKGSVLKTRRVY